MLNSDHDFRFGLRFRPGAGATGQPATLMTPGNNQDLTARRARRVRPEPRVNARQVESVTTLRQHTELVAGGELRQTDRALGEFLRRRRLRRESQLRERLEHFFLQSFVRRRCLLRRRLAGTVLGSGGGSCTGGETAEPDASRNGD